MASVEGRQRLAVLYAAGAANLMVRLGIRQSIPGHIRSAMEGSLLLEVRALVPTTRESLMLRELNTAAYYRSHEGRTFVLVLEWILEARENSFTSHETHRLAFRHEIAQNSAVRTARDLLKEGIIYQFGYGVGNKDGRRDSAVYMAGSYAWSYVVALVVSHSNGSFGLDWNHARPKST